jgi:hypothetical protein
MLAREEAMHAAARRDLTPLLQTSLKRLVLRAALRLSSAAIAASVVLVVVVVILAAVVAAVSTAAAAAPWIPTCSIRHGTVALALPRLIRACYPGSGTKLRAPPARGVIS